MPEARPGGLTAGVDPAVEGEAILELMRELWPLPRSLTGDGVRATLLALTRYVPITQVEVPTGTELFDWRAPREWSLREAWIAGPDGQRIVDSADSTLHVVGYSRSARETLSGAELDEHLHSLPGRIPYRTAYWSDTWGFCLTDEVRRTIDPDARYEVCVDTSLEDGSLTFGEAVLEGETGAEILLSTYVCHPSLANDNLSGVATLALLASQLKSHRLRRTHRLLWSPGTLGPLAWLHANRTDLERIGAGLVLACTGDPGPLRYKRSRRGDAPVDRAAAHVLRHRSPDAIVEDFVPWGGDERQFCSPGFDLPVGVLTRTPHGLFPEYHSSADDLDFVRAECLGDTLAAALEILDVLERDRVHVSRSPYGEPQLGRRGLYRELTGAAEPDAEELFQRAVLWTLNLADGKHSTLDVAERAGLPFAVAADAAAALTAADLIEEGP